jgi:hypothetical protein|eukprot:SAG25_NODE_1087_length_4070_cov_7.651977_3_plen_82_part_00
MLPLSHKLQRLYSPNSARWTSMVTCVTASVTSGANSSGLLHCPGHRLRPPCIMHSYIWRGILRSNKASPAAFPKSMLVTPV